MPTNRQTTDNASPAQADRRHIWIALALATLTFGVYSRVAGFDFVNYDDQVYVSENRNIEDGFTGESLGYAFTTNDGGNWHPLVWLSILLDVEMHGLDPGGHHVSNLLYHVANTVLLFYAFRLLTGGIWASAMVAALFGLHPLHVESVAWISERKDTLSTLFWILTMIAYGYWVKRPTVSRYVWIVLAYAAGLMSKSMLVTLPCVLLLLDVWPLKRLPLRGLRWSFLAGEAKGPAPSWRTIWSLFKEKLPLFGLALALCLVTIWAQKDVGAMASTKAISFDIRLRNAWVSYAAYLGKTLWPTALQVFYPHPLKEIGWVGPLLSLAAILSVSALAVRYVRRWPFLAVGWFWYVGTLVPVIGLVQVGEQAMADRYTYVPLIGIFLVAAWGIPKLIPDSRQRRILPALSASVLLACGVLTWRQVGHWRDSASLFGHAIEVNPDNYLAHGNIASSLAKDEHYEQAISHFDEVLRIKPRNVGALSGKGASLYKLERKEEAIALYERALAIRPKDPDTNMNYGVALADRGLYDRALEHYRLALEDMEDDAKLHYSIGTARHALGQRAEAEAAIRQAIELEPDYAAAHNQLGIILREQGDFEAAMQAYQKALELEPDLGEAYHNLAVLFERLDRDDLARANYETALENGYESEKLRFNLGLIYHQSGDLETAIEHYRKATEVEPTYSPAFNNLAIALAARGDHEQAVGAYEAALALRPDDAGFHNNLAVSLVNLQRFEAAIDHFQAALRLKPDYGSAQKGLETARRLAAEANAGREQQPAP